jgi:SSS family solute:Na+ symporter
MWTVKNIPDLNGANPLLILINHVIPLPVSIVLCVGLLSTLLSSVDTCLVNAASIIEHDIIGKDSVMMTRVFVAVLGMLGLLISLFKTDIIGLLLSAYSIYTPGIVFPLFVSIMTYQKSVPNRILLAAAVIAGSILGFWQPLLAMAVSCGISLFAVFFGKKIKIN